MKKTFRGLLRDGDTLTIRLSTNDGKTGYKIRKFDIMAYQPGALIQESVVQLYTVKPSAATATIDFDNPLLLGAAIWQGHDGSNYQFTKQTVFDNITFNQDIYLTHVEVDGSAPVNFYLELEQVKLDLGEATVATLKDMRGSN